MCTSFSEAAACQPEIIGLRKEFRRSKNVFIGEVVSVDSVRKQQSPQRLVENWGPLDKITFRIKRAWKGQGTGTISVFSNVYCSCPSKLLEFKEGREFIIFSDSDAVADACSLHIRDVADSRWATEYVARDMKRLDSFWFRTWASIYPF